MDLISDLLLLPITGPVRGLEAILEAVRDEADATRYDLARARAELSDLELRRDLGDISEEEYQEQETTLLERLNEGLAREEERRREEPPRLVEGEIVGELTGEVLGSQSSLGDSGGYVEYVDGEFADEDVTEEDDGAEPPEARRR